MMDREPSAASAARRREDVGTLGGTGEPNDVARTRTPRPAARSLTARYGTVSLLQELAIALPMPVLVVHMTGRGLGLDTVGLAFALRAVLVVALEVPTGGLADAIGRKTVALLSQLFTLASFVALLLVTSPFLALVYAVLQGIGAALHSGALEAWYVDGLRRVDPGAELQDRLAVVNSLQSAGLLVGTAVGGFLPGWVAPLDLPFPLGGFGIALFAGLLMRAVVWLLTLLLVDEHERRRQPPTTAGWRATGTIIADAVRLARRGTVLPFLLLASVGSGVAMISIETFWQPVAQARLDADASHSIAFGVFGILMGTAAVVGGLLVARYGNRVPGGSAVLAALTMLLRGGALLLFALTPSTVLLGAAFALVYLGIGASHPPHDALLHGAIPDERRSSMLSIDSLATFAGIGLGSGLLGWLASATSPHLALVVAATVTLVSSAAYLVVARATAEEAILGESTAD